MNKIYDKIVTTIYSCKNYKQLDCVVNFVKLAVNYLPTHLVNELYGIVEIRKVLIVCDNTTIDTNSKFIKDELEYAYTSKAKKK